MLDPSRPRHNYYCYWTCDDASSASASARSDALLRAGALCRLGGGASSSAGAGAPAGAGPEEDEEDAPSDDSAAVGSGSSTGVSLARGSRGVKEPLRASPGVCIGLYAGARGSTSQTTRPSSAGMVDTK